MARTKPKPKPAPKPAKKPKAKPTKPVPKPIKRRPIPVPPPPPPAEPIADFKPEWIEPALLLLISNAPTATVRAALTGDKIGVPADALEPLLAEARRRIVLAANYDATKELGLAIQRLNDLYNRSVSMQDVKSAIQAQKEINRLLRLNTGPSAKESNAGDSADPSQAEATLAAIEAHLRPLNLAPPAYPLDEVARILAHKLIDHVPAGSQ